jgi:hypothetical protein
LRCAVALERPHYEQLPTALGDEVELRDELSALISVAPRLSNTRVDCVRALCRRGRVWKAWIWVGLPGSEVGPSVEHAAWQAAHEATVSEVQDAAAREQNPCTERETELVALVLLAERARRTHKTHAHLRWLNTLALPEGLRAAAGRAACALDSLPPRLLALSQLLLARSE